MQLDLIIATYNRSALLRGAVESIFRADRPDELVVNCVIVDNASTDDTAEVARELRARHAPAVSYVFEPTGGKSQALNTGIAVTTGELVGMIDDDEEIHPGWLRQVLEAFRDPSVDFIGGPYVPRWPISLPEWVPQRYLGAVGWVDNGQAASVFTPAFPGILKGGNAVIRRTVLNRVGRYATHLGPTPEYRLMSCEDEDMYFRLLAAGARGVYLPQMIVYHHIGSERLTRSYFRRWCFWRGVSQGLRDRETLAPVPRVLGVPRWILGAAVRATGARIRSWFRWSRHDFSEELAMWDLVGFFYGRHFHRGGR
jgi:glycosyltransferase involved in cell wall biosynthesis